LPGLTPDLLGKTSGLPGLTPDPTNGWTIAKIISWKCDLW